jgi:DNA-binding NarL/FixJ family response regulator
MGEEKPYPALPRSTKPGSKLKKQIPPIGKNLHHRFPSPQQLSYNEPRAYGFGNVYASGTVGTPSVAGTHGVLPHVCGARVVLGRGGSVNGPVLRILIADDHEVARSGIRAVLEGHPAWEVCGEAKDGREAVDLADKLKPNIVLMDIGMPNLNGLDAARQILSVTPDARILILTMHDTDQVVREVLSAGARGFLLKSDAGRDLVTAVEALQQNRTFFTTKVAQMVLDGYLHPESEAPSSKHLLTPREREVIQLLAEGKTSKEVAVALKLSVKTAETHRTNLMRKLDLHSVADLTLYAVRNGIVQIY